MKQPKIRMRGFDGEWEETRFVDYVDRLSTSDTSDNYPSVEYEDIISGEGLLNKDVSKKSSIKRGVKFKNGDVLFGKLRPYLKNIYYANFEGVAVGDFWALRPKNGDSKFLYLLVNSKEFMEVSNMSVGSKMPRADWSLVSSTYFAIPKPKEQTAIAKYFTALDGLIQATAKELEKLRTVKAASLQALFPQEGQTSPKLRFKGFTGEWKRVKLSEFAKRVTRKNSNLESTLALTIASAYGLVSQVDYFNNLVVGSNIKNYYLLKKGEFAYNKSYSNGYPFGSVKRLDRYDMGILSTLYIVFSINSTVDSDYITHFFSTNLWHKDVADRAEEGARNHGLLNIGADSFLDISICMPSDIAEQRKIASYLQSLDNQIDLQAKRLEKLRNIKAACLDNMFV